MYTTIISHMVPLIPEVVVELLMVSLNNNWLLFHFSTPHVAGQPDDIYDPIYPPNFMDVFWGFTCIKAATFK